MRTILIGVALAVCCAFAPPIHAVEDGETRFTIEILGTSRFGDIAAVQDSLRYAEGMQDLRVVRSNRDYVKLEGTTKATGDDLASDIASLAQDRFDMQTDRQHDGSLNITLRKLARQRSP